MNEPKKLPIVIPPAEAPTLVTPAGWNPDFSKEQRDYLASYFKSQQAGPTASLALICKWEDCIYKGHCPLFQMKISDPPIGKPCPVEATLVEQHMFDFKKELGIEDADITDIAILKEVVIWQMLQKRAIEELAQDPKNIRETIVGVDEEGDPISKEMMNPAITMLEKAAKTKLRYWEALIATREAKAKDKSRKQTNLSDFSALVQKRILDRKLRLGKVTPLEEPLKELTARTEEILEAIQPESVPARLVENPQDEVDFGM